MIRTLLSVFTGIAIGGLLANHHEDKEHAGQEKVKPLASREIVEEIDGKSATATVVEVTLAAGESGSPHRHPGPVFGYVLEGEYELGIDDKPSQRLKQGETFYEPTGCLHRVSKNPAEKGKTRVLAIVLHAREKKEIVLPASQKE